MQVQLESCRPERGTWSTGLNFYSLEPQRVTDSPIKWADGRHSDIAVFLDTACIQSCLETDVTKITTRRDSPNPTKPFEIQVKPSKGLAIFPQNLYIL
jgi:hypothetical protein